MCSSTCPGLCTLVGIILFIGAITEIAGHSSKAKGGEEPKFRYHYGSSFVLTVASFIVAELTGVLSVYLYISRHKHAYQKKQERVVLHNNPSLTPNSRNFHPSRSQSAERSRDNSPTHSDTIYSYTPVSECSKDISHYTFPREPSRYTLPETRAPVVRTYSTHSHAHSLHHTPDTYASRRDLDNYSRPDGEVIRELENYARNREVEHCRRDYDTYSRRTTPV
jgi:hypothetical protein